MRFPLTKTKFDVANRAAEAVHASNLALRLSEDGKVAVAKALYRRAIEINPNDEKPRLSLASILINEGEHDAALSLIGSSTDPIAFTVRSIAALVRRDLPEAIHHARAADERDPAGAAKRVVLSTALLLSGDWPAGWDAYDEVVKSSEPGRLPRWDGSRVGKLVVLSQQGVGDIIQICRYLTWAAGRVQRGVFKCRPELWWLLQGFSRYVDIVQETREADGDAEIGIMALPRLHGTKPDNVPMMTAGMLVTDQVDVPKTRDLAVGIVWAGNAQYMRDRQRSMRLDDMIPLAGNPRLRLFSLQAGARASDVVAMGAQALIHDLSGQIMPGWSFCAGALKQMDAVVTVDTAVAHLAGSLGVRTYLCLPWVPDWRWGLEGKTTPWYPSVRLCRQSRPGDWGSVIDGIAAELA